MKKEKTGSFKSKTAKTAAIKMKKFYRFQFQNTANSEIALSQDVIIEARSVLDAGRKMIKENSDALSKDPRFVLKFLVGMGLDKEKLAALEVKR